MAKRGGAKMKRPAANDDVIPPTPEQQANGSFRLEDVTDRIGSSAIRIGKAYRRRPMIDTLLNQDIITPCEHKALKHYRHHADLADRSPVRDSLCLQRGGSGSGPTISTLNAWQIVRDCESAVGSLADILRAVVVYDVSLSQWAMHKHGSVERCRNRAGAIVCQPEPRPKMLDIARMEIRIAAQRVKAELVA